MKTAAIIAEYNPFHNGHAHMIAKLRQAAPGAAVIAIMSGDFTQRGEAAVIGKYARARAAVRCGCDLVLELPAPWCFSGAEFFARGGTGIANSLGCVDTLAFGAECADTTALTLAAERMRTPEFAAALEAERRTRLDANAAKLRADVYAHLYGDAMLFSGSNNLLALEYLQSLQEMGSEICPYAVKRLGGEFNDTALAGMCSATAIRAALAEEKPVAEFLPAASAEILAEEAAAGRIYSMARLDTAAAMALRTADAKRLAGIMEISGGMEHRLIRAAREHRTIEAIVAACEERRYSKSRLRRAILSAMLGVTMDMAEEYPRFTVLLAANARGREVLGRARKSAEIAIISKSAQLKALDDAARRQWAVHSAAMAAAELACAAEPELRQAYMEE